MDDDSDARDVLKMLLEIHGALVTSVGSSDEALKALTLEPDVLIADIGMPEQDGYSLIHAIRALDASKGGDIPAIAVTGYAGSRERERALDAGYEWHVAKPVDPGRLIELISVAARIASRRRTHERT